MLRANLFTIIYVLLVLILIVQTTLINNDQYDYILKGQGTGRRKGTRET